MADNETNYNEILYDFKIDGNTVWSSHDENGILISQRIYEEYDDDTFHAVCDIPCYPTGLFLHLDISGDIKGAVIRPHYSIAYQINKDFKIEYYPYNGLINVFGKTISSGAGWDVEISSALNIKYVWGSCVPKTYCANGEKIFGYHKFVWKKIDDYDLKEKWYIGKFKTYRPEKDTSLSRTGTGTMPHGDTTTTVEIDCPADWNGDKSDFSVDCSVVSGSVKYNGYTFKQKSIVMEFTCPQQEASDRTIRFNYTFKYKTKAIPCNELQSISNIIFMDPNLLCFTTRAVNGNQTDEDMVRYPMYKAIDDEAGNHQAIYLLNRKDLKEGIYDFLSVTGKSYTYTKDDQYYESFNYGYMSNAPQGNLFDKDGKAITIKKWPVDDGAVAVLSVADNNNSSYYNKTSPAFNASLVSRYGIQGTAIRSMLKDSPFAKDQEDNTKWLMEEKDEKTNLLYQNTAYNSNNPLLLYTSDDKKLKRLPKYSTLIDQFHLLIEDVVYRVPLNWHIQIVKKKSVINSIKTDWYYEYKKDYNFSSDTAYYWYYLKPETTGKLIIDSTSTIEEQNWKKLNDTTKYFDLLNHSWEYQLKTNIQGRAGYDNPTWGTASERYEIRWNLSQLNILFKDLILAIKDHPLYATSPFNIKHHELNTTYSIIGETETSKTLIPSNNASISSSKQSFDNLIDSFFLFYIGLGIQKPGYRLTLNQEINSVPSDPEMESYGEKIVITNNMLEYTKPGTTKRTIKTTETFASSQNKEITPAGFWGEASFNGIPLISYWSDSNSTSLDEWEGHNYFFNCNLITETGGRSAGLDAYAQFFDYDQYPEESIFIYAWPDKK